MLSFLFMPQKMGLAFLVGSEGHFGQNKLNSTMSTAYSSPDDSVLLLSDREICGLVELLANTMHDRSKDGAGGYSAATFSVKYVLSAWRCLLTYALNQSRVASMVGAQLNSLLLKALARHAISRTQTVDAEAAEHAAFSLYLQSSYGFKVRRTHAFLICQQLGFGFCECSRANSYCYSLDVGTLPSSFIRKPGRVQLPFS